MAKNSEQIEKELSKLHEEIKKLSGQLVEREQTATKPGRLNTNLGVKLSELETKEWELLKEYIKLYNPNSAL